MKLPQHIQEAICFSYEDYADLILAMDEYITSEEQKEIERLVLLGIPPLTSKEVLATMLGVNKGLLWSIFQNKKRYYRHFKLINGTKERHIFAPRIVLKVIQKWLSFHLQKNLKFADHVHGFVPKKSHITAAKTHLNANWVYSVDIENFFPTTTKLELEPELLKAGLGCQTVGILLNLCCLAKKLPQGAPTSPVLSNVAFQTFDKSLSDLAEKYSVRLSRYADDVVFSGIDDFPSALVSEVDNLFQQSRWKLAEKKRKFSKHPARLKVHGLLVHGDELRLTKGYRNKLRAYRHLYSNDKISQSDLAKVKGHLNYSEQISKN